MQQLKKFATTASIPMAWHKQLFAAILGLLAFLLRCWARLRRSTDRQSGLAVLILEPFGLGDIISFEPLVRVLLREGREVRICARPEWRVLFDEKIAWLPARIPWGSHDSGAKYRTGDYLSRAFLDFIRDLRKLGRGTIGVDTRGDVRSVLLLYLAGCSKVVTLSNYLGSDLEVLSIAAERVTFAPELRRWEINLRFLSSLGLRQSIEVLGPAFNFPLPPMTERVSQSGKRAALIPVAPWKGKWWQAAKWRQVIERLRADGWDVVALCGPAQAGVAKEALGGVLEVVECRTVSAWVDSLKRFSLVITLDTGPMHLADALGIPVVALFGQGLLPLWAPSNPDSHVVTHQDAADFLHCQPTNENTRHGEEFMRRITVDEVLAAVRRISPT